MKKINFESIVNILLKNFFQGLVIIGPIGLTIFVIWYIISSIDNIIPSVAKEIPGLVFVSAILITALLGYLGNKFVMGKFFFEAVDSLLEKTPGVKHIYTPTKDVMSSFVGDKKKFNHPVWVKTNEHPEIWRIGFLTQKEMADVDKHNYVAVYLPHSYAISGWVIITEEKNIKPVVGMTAASAMKFAVSGGVAGFHSDENIFKSSEEKI
ncbi:DUF502 domain-containing protein [Chryseobacterium potabilaquae]|uniref:DUF502 domain-containing protein n=1 Tax=Chryseobacterium potabilaquae TaxID=2675057 RepID=A0A6N4X9P2_9FLAO|nr:DUF502 domain-containing protein [Chryseobacterium potabilaquae]CAA7196432.1 hypothetical protein CHRY9293_02523 [Chryseobacterium potabilaquae]